MSSKRTANSKKAETLKKRGNSWSNEETLVLLGIWNDNSIEEQLESPLVNNASIYNSISNEILEKEFEKTADQCKIRIHTLKRAYRDCKGKLNKSDKRRRTCKFFEELDAILGTRPASSPVKLIETRKRSQDPESSDDESSDKSEGDAGSDQADRDCSDNETDNEPAVEPSQEPNQDANQDANQETNGTEETNKDKTENLKNKQVEDNAKTKKRNQEKNQNKTEKRKKGQAGENVKRQKKIDPANEVIT